MNWRKNRTQHLPDFHYFWRSLWLVWCLFPGIINSEYFNSPKWTVLILICGNKKKILWRNFNLQPDLIPSQMDLNAKWSSWTFNFICYLIVAVSVPCYWRHFVKWRGLIRAEICLGKMWFIFLSLLSKAELWTLMIWCGKADIMQGEI